MIYIGTDHGGLELKEELLAYIKNELKIEIQDLGIYEKKSVDYPDIAQIVCKKVLDTRSLGILICGTGIGISISANKINGIRCALCSEEYSAKMARVHNNANILALGGRTVGPELAKSIAKIFITTEFTNEERHSNRICKILEIENS